MPELHNSEIFKMIRKEIIKVNGKKIDQNYVLAESDKISFFVAEHHFVKNEKQINVKFHSVNSKIDIVFEDENVLAVNKEAGTLIHPDKNEFRKALSEMVKAYLYKKGQYNPKDFFTPSPCHRLDTNTSGIVVFAKNQKTLQAITEQFRQRETEKIYLALFYGKIINNVLLTSVIDASENRENKVIVEDFKSNIEIPKKKEFLDNNPGLSATLVRPLKWNDNCTLAEIDLWTGKKHQIRTHLQANRTPLLGDNKYYTKNSMLFSQDLNIKNYFLHSFKLKLEGYDEWTAPINSEFKKIIFDILEIEI